MSQVRKPYTIGWFEAGPERRPSPPFRARGWHVTYRSHRYLEGNYQEIERLTRAGEFVTGWHEVDKDRQGRKVYATSPEIIINAVDRLAAQRAANLILAGHALLDGQLLIADQVLAIPLDPSELEDLSDLEYKSARSSRLATEGVADGARCAARATMRKIWTHALFKYLTSLKICSVPWMELHPRYGTRYGIENDPANHVIFALSIVAAYSVIEELGLEVRASNSRPSLIQGQWNPRVLRDLEARLESARIDLSEPLIWNIRGTPTRIERRRGTPAGSPASWAIGPIRDRGIPLANAINYASWLRSKVSAHRLSKLTTSLTIYDVNNVQHVARRLLMETLGFWRR